MQVTGTRVFDNYLRGREGHPDLAALLKLRDRWVGYVSKVDWRSRADVETAAPKADFGAWPQVRFRLNRELSLVAVIDVADGVVGILWVGRTNAGAARAAS